MQKLERHDESIRHFKKMLQEDPQSSEALNNLANSYNETGRYNEAIDLYSRAVKIAPKHAVMQINLGNTFRNASRYDEALRCFKRSIKLDPKDPRAHNGLGLTYQSLNKEQEAIKAYRKAIELKPDYPEAPNNLAVSLQNLGNYYEAMKVYAELIEKHPDRSQVYFNLGSLLQVYSKHDGSLTAFRKALEVDPDNNLVYPFLAHALMQQCNWENLEGVVARVIENTKKELEKAVQPSVSPFGLQSMPASKDIRKRTAIVTSERNVKQVRHQKSIFEKLEYTKPKNGKLKIGFLSADFRRHSVAIAFKGVVEKRNTKKFSYHAYSISTYGRDHITEEFEELFDSFTDITLMPHLDSAKKILNDGINILIDLTGHTRGCRYEVLALRPAPVQAHWLGFSSTTGASFIDYLVTDQIQNPVEEEEFVTEKLVHLPDTFMATSHPTVSSKQFTRTEQDLPENGFVFANFNSHYKFYPSMFAIWMRLLRKIPGSVLWLIEGSQNSQKNLKQEAKHRGIDPDRIIFAKNLPHDEHLSRLQLADLCLDNQYHGGGVTTTDALWMTVPVLTLHGATPPARNGSTLLNALGMPELITYSLLQYEDTALHYANNSKALKNIKKKIRKNRVSKPLFDIALLTKNLEKSFELMWQNYQSGKKPAHIKVTAE